VLGRLAKATAPTSSVSFSYDAFGRVNARVFTDLTATSNNVYVNKYDYHGDGTLQSIHLLLPDNTFNDEHVEYTYDSAGRTSSVTYNGNATQSLFAASGSAASTTYSVVSARRNTARPRTPRPTRQQDGVW